jgi:hypothetical protein
VKFTGKVGLVPRIAIVICLFIVLTSAGNMAFRSFSVGNIGYSSAFEGPKASFYGIGYGGKQFTRTSFAGASEHQFDTVLRFDADEGDRGKPNLRGEMTSVFIPSDTLGGMKPWIPTEWLSQNKYITNPQKTYEWNISGKAYKMEQWLMRYYVAFNAEWDQHEDPYTDVFSGSTNVYNNLDLWIDFDITPTWYLQGQGVAYFAIGSISLAETVKYDSKLAGGGATGLPPRSAVSISPESQSSSMFIYYAPWGQDAAGQTAQNFQGRELNPDYFREHVYGRVSFNNFGVEAWTDWFTNRVRGDTAVMVFDVTVFVIGEWKVQDIRDNPESYGRFERAYIPPSIADYLLSPTGLSIISVLVIIGLIIAVLVFAPWIIMPIIKALTGSGKG